MVWLPCVSCFSRSLASRSCALLVHVLFLSLCLPAQPVTRTVRYKASGLPYHKVGTKKKEDRFPRGRQIAHMVYDYFWVTGTDDTVLDYADLITITLDNDDVQEFDTRLDEILLLWTKIPSDNILESLYALRKCESDQLKNIIGIVRHGNSSENIDADYQKMKTMVKRRIDQKLRLRNFDARNERNETGAVVTNHRDQRGG